jgi:hypothetical protein
MDRSNTSARLLAQSRKKSSASYTIMDGRDHIGTVDLVDGMYVVADVSGQVVGRHKNLQTAVRALPSWRAP